MVPWAASTLADALSRRGDHGREEVLLYAAILMFGTVTWWLVFHTLAIHPELLADPDDSRGFRADRIGTLVGFSGTTLASAAGFLWSPVAATVLFLALPVFLAVASEGFERASLTPEGSVRRQANPQSGLDRGAQTQLRRDQILIDEGDGNEVD